MSLLSELYTHAQALHHAYLIEGELTAVIEALYTFFRDALSIEPLGNPDVWLGEYDTVGIHESRELAELQSRRPVAGSHKLFIIAANFLTHEAQNALLKVFEEPTEGTHFFLVSRSAERLLPTLRSRLCRIRSTAEEATAQVPVELVEDCQRFLSATPAERAQIIKPLIDAKDKAGAITFLANLETTLRQQKDPRQWSDEDVCAFREIARARDYLHDRAPSVKMLLEHVVGVLP